MADVVNRVPWNYRSFINDNRMFKFPQNTDSNSSDMELEFLQDGNEEFLETYNEGGDDLHSENNGSDVENKDEFWEIQHQVLQATLCRSSFLESKIRNAVTEALKDIQIETTVCGCGKSLMAENCSNCLMRQIFTRLKNAGFHIAIFRSKWRSSVDIPSGEHSFLGVIENSRKGDARVIIELNFRAEFEIARASEDYNHIVQRLPEVFVGKVERLNNVIKILCLAAKKCMKEKKMHMGPWRKQRYMQAKWLKSWERNTSTKSLPVEDSAGRLPKPKASLLTLELLEKLSDMRCTAVEVQMINLKDTNERFCNDQLKRYK